MVPSSEATSTAPVLVAFVELAKVSGILLVSFSE